MRIRESLLNWNNAVDNCVDITFVILFIACSAVALHCCKANAKINGKIENSTPCKIVTHEDFNLQLGTRDYVGDATHHATLGSNRHRGLPPKQGKYLTFVTFLLYCFFFSSLPPGRTVALILMLNGSNDVFPPKDGPFGG